MVNISDRWNRDKTDDLQFAFFNGDRLGELGKYLGHLERNYSTRRRSHTPHGNDRARRSLPSLPAQEWEPFLSDAASWCIRQPMAAEWSTPSGRSSTATNTTSPDRQIEVPRETGVHYFDLYHGTELTPERARR